MRIGELARVSGASADTIRYYERIGLMPAPRRTPGGYREYPAGAANRIRIIRNAAQLGFPLQEIARVLRIRDSGGAPCRQVRDYARSLVGGIEQRIAELQAERKAMRKMIKAWDSALVRTSPDTPVHLLESDSIAIRRPVPKHARLRQSR
jgi:MerR family transcriptional regulator, copper efflux regulator